MSEEKKQGHQCQGAIEHYREKYPGGRVQAGDDFVDVFCSGGKHQVALRRNGAGQWVCQSEAHGCVSKHDMEKSEKPQPKKEKSA